MSDLISKQALIEWLDVEIDLSHGSHPVLKADWVAERSDVDTAQPTAQGEPSCTHERKSSYNHGYHTVCLDCGEEL